VIRYAGDPTWPELDPDLDPDLENVSGMSTVVAMAVIDYGYRLDPDDDHYVLRLHIEGTVSDDHPGDRDSAIRSFYEGLDWLRLDEIPMLPPPWNDIRADARLEEQRSALLREEFGESPTYPWGLRCAATCRECDAALLEIGRTDWAVVRAAGNHLHLDSVGEGLSDQPRRRHASRLDQLKDPEVRQQTRSREPSLERSVGSAAATQRSP
jgi:hypothetical protein